jgi:inosine/xanthosine triphosphate pyrophosphatase family protein
LSVGDQGKHLKQSIKMMENKKKNGPPENPKKKVLYCSRGLVPTSLHLFWGYLLLAKGLFRFFLMGKRVILVVTSNPVKFEEIAKHFALYGETCEQVAEIPVNPTEEVFVILREQTVLVSSSTQKEVEPSHMEVVQQRSELFVRFKEKNSKVFVEKTFLASTEGYLDYSRKADCNEQVFGFDDIFVLSATGKTFHELKKKGFKVSARNKTIVQFIKERIWYDKYLDLAHEKFEPDKCVMLTVG